MVGFHPSESLVILCLHGPRHRAGSVLRIDLPESENLDAYATELAGRVAREHADGVIVICYTSGPDTGAGLSWSDLVDLVLAELTRQDVGWIEALLVRNGRWWSYKCDKPCCPREGTALPTSPSSKVAEIEAQRALQGIAVLPGREALEKSVEGPVALRLVALRQHQMKLAERLAEEMTTLGLQAVREQTLAVARDAFRRFVEGERDIEDAEAVRILLGLQDKWPRDAMITWGVSKHLDDVIAFLTCLAQRAPDENAAPICTVLAAVAYQSGRGALASVALERALRHDPDYEMARLLISLLDGQVNPREIRAMARRAQRELDQPSIDDERPAAA